MSSRIKFYVYVVLALCLASCVSQDKKTYKLVQNNVYKTIKQEKLVGDLYVPTSTGLRPAVVLVHGGGWRKRSGDMSHIAEILVRRGYVVFNVTYRLAPASTFPAAVEDVRDSIQWLINNANQYSVDRQKIVAWGYSAGAHLVLMAGLDPAMNLKAIVSGGTPADLLAWPNSTMVEDFIGKKYQDDPLLWRNASPVYQVQAKSPPVFLYHGELDSIVEKEQMYKMKKALVEKSVPVETYEASWLGHLATYFYSDESIKKGTNFIDRILLQTSSKDSL